MTMTKPVSPTQTQILSAAVRHPARLAAAPKALPSAARNAVFRSLVRAGLLEEVPSPDGAPTTLRITAAGLAAVGGPAPDEVPEEASVGVREVGKGEGAALDAPELREAPASSSPSPRSTSALRGAATAVLATWDAGEGQPGLPGAVEALRAALSRAGATRSARDPSAPRRLLEATKQATVLALLRRPEGATIAQVVAVTGWAQHTVRGFLAGLKKKGHAVEVLERVRQVGPGAQGAKGSYSIYHIAAGEQG